MSNERRYTPEEMFDENSDCQFENEHNELERAMTKDAFCDIIREYESEIKSLKESNTELSIRITKVEFQENIDDVIKKSMENAQEVIRLSTLCESLNKENGVLSNIISSISSKKVVESKEMAIEFARWFYLNCISSNRYDPTMRTFDELFNEFLKEKGEKNE